MSLYRKYRPQTFATVVGQPQVTTVLSRAIAAGQPAHAYLFAGPRGTGKTSVARITAKSLNCSQKKPGQSDPCNTCENCQAIDKGAFLDVLELDAASNRGIDEIRQLKEQVSVSPLMGEYKVYILDEAHMLTDAAFNALLKTLEEPPPKVVFILCTTEAHKIPVTIASRCQRLLFKRADLENLTSQLKTVAKAEKVKIDDQAIDLLASLADGGYRDAEMLLEQVIVSNQSDKVGIEAVQEQLGLASQQTVDQVVECIIQNQTDKLLQHIEQFSSSGGNIRQLTDSLIDQYRLLLLVKIDAKLASQTPTDKREHLVGLASQVEQAQLLNTVDALLKARQALQHYQGHHQALALETALLEALQEPKLAPAVPSAKGEAREKAQVTKDQAAPVVSNPPKPSPPQTTEEKAVKEDKDQAQVATKPTAVAEPPADLLDLWSKILEVIRPQSRSVEALLRDCVPVSFDGTILSLQFWYIFHKKQLDMDKNRHLVEEAASQVVGSQVKVETQLGDKNQRPKRQPMGEEDIQNVAAAPVEENLVDAAMEIFGGEIVE